MGCGGDGVVSGDRVVRVCWGAWYCSWWADGECGRRMWAATSSAPTVCPLTTRPVKSTCEPCTPVSTMYTRTPLPVMSPSS